MKLNERLRLKQSEEALQAARGEITETRDTNHRDPLDLGSRSE